MRHDNPGEFEVDPSGTYMYTYSLQQTMLLHVSLSPPSNFLGCPMIIKLGCRSEHENDCEYAPVQCPNSSKCAVVQKKDLSDHLKECRHVRCPHYRYKYVM